MFTVSSLCIRLFELEISQDENYNIKKNEENNILELFSHSVILFKIYCVEIVYEIHFVYRVYFQI
jgi:hypothetical protein